MRKLLLAGALVLAVACQKETIEEQANDFVSVEDIKASSAKPKNASLSYNLGEAFNNDVARYIDHYYLGTWHEANIDGVDNIVYVHFKSPIASLEDFTISSIEIYEKYAFKGITLFPQDLDDNYFSFDLQSGEFYANANWVTEGSAKGVSIEFEGKIEFAEHELRSLSYSEIDQGDVFEINGITFTSGSAIPWADNEDYIQGDVRVRIMELVNNEWHPRSLSIDYYVELEEINSPQDRPPYKLKLLYNRDGALVNSVLFNNNIWRSYNGSNGSALTRWLLSLNALKTGYGDPNDPF